MDLGLSTSWTSRKERGEAVRDLAEAAVVAEAVTLSLALEGL